MSEIVKTNSHWGKVISLITIMALIWLVWPFYMFAAYRSNLPKIPFSYVDIPKDNPTVQEVYNPTYKEVSERALKTLLDHKKQINAPGISAAVSIKGEVVWNGAVGWADIKTNAPTTLQTQFRIGSTTKAVTATGLARLVDADIIDLDTPISHYIEELPNSAWEDITPRQLASHMAGLPDYSSNTDLMGLYHSGALRKRFNNVFEALEVFDGSDLLFKPGSNFQYSGYSAVLLSAVMEAATGQPFLEIIKEQVFQPLKMTSTLAEYESTDNSEFATFYWNGDGATDHVQEWRHIDLSHRLAAAGLISTSSDLVKLAAGMLNDNFITEETRNIFWTPQRLDNGEVNEEKYALGWRVYNADFGDHNIEALGINHGGVTRGAQSWLVIYPDYDLAVAININAKTKEFWDFAKVGQQIAHSFINHSP